MKSYLIRILLLSTLVLSSCGQRYHLSRAKKLNERATAHKLKAIEKGAKISIDTVWTRIKLRTLPLDVEWEPKLAIKTLGKDTVYTFRADVEGSNNPAEAKVVIQRDTITKIIVRCPDRPAEVDVPTSTNETITVRPRYGFWEGLLLGLIIGGIGLALFVLKGKGG